MKVVIQRVKKAEVFVNNKLLSSINYGMLVLLGVHESDTNEDMDYIVKKLLQLRIFDDENGVMNLNVSQIGGEIMLVSQFTLLAYTKKGNRPSYVFAMEPQMANIMVNKVADKIEELFDKKIAKGAFGEHMEISLINDGPVTIIIDSKNKEV